MLKIARTDTSLIGRWWWTVDRLTLAAVILLMILGIFLILAASPAVADQHNWSSFHFVKKHLIFLIPALVMMIGISLLSPQQNPSNSRLSLYFWHPCPPRSPSSQVLRSKVPDAGWTSVSSPSSPVNSSNQHLPILSAWCFARQHTDDDFPGQWVSMGLYGLVVLLLLLQPDLGMVLLVTAMWLSQFFLAGLSILWIGIAAGLGVVGSIAAYFIFPPRPPTR